MIDLSSARRSKIAQGVLPCCLTIAGSDSGGNAGVQADLRTFHAFGVHGCTVFTALTAQNPNSVAAIHLLDGDFVASQLNAVLGVYSIAALKTGMIGSAEVVEVVATKLKSHPEIIKIVDPVIVATSGNALVSSDAITALKKYLLPMADLITPNILEAEMLWGREVKTESDIFAAAQGLSEEYGCKVLVKGGHGDMPRARDILFDGGEFSVYELERIISPMSTHGTGCTLASAVAAGLALGKDLKDAVMDAKKYVHNAIATSYLVGESCGVLGF